MSRAAPRILSRERWRACWPLVLLALAVRIGVAGLAQPAAAIEQRAVLGALCDGGGHRSDAPKHHRSADADEAALVLAGELSAAAEPRVATAVPVRGAAIAVPSPRCLPPGRGPPFRTARVGAPRAPPLLA